MVAATTSATTPGTSKPIATTKKKGKKRKVSKHIAESVQQTKSAFQTPKNEESGRVEIMEDPRPSPSTGAPTLTKKRMRATHVKDPEEAAAYLTTWENKRGWKFNKNTQSWLIRHMYTDKLSKASFSTLLDYLNSAGDTTKERIVQDATRRAMRYQQYATPSPSTGTTGGSVPDQQDESGGQSIARDTRMDPDGIDEAQVWSGLSDHDKRKEYKRARKALDTLRLVKS